MFAILQNAVMESSHLGRPSLDNSPTSLPLSSESPPPPLIPYFKVDKENDAEAAAKLPDTENLENMINDVSRIADAHVKFEPNDEQPNSQMLKQRLELYWKGMMKYQQELLQRNKENTESGRMTGVDQISAIPISKREGITSHQHSTSAIETIPVKEVHGDNSAMKRESSFPQHTLATAIAMRNLQQNRHCRGDSWASLLPPPPELLVSASLPSATSNSLLPNSSSTVLAQIPHSSSRELTNLKPTTPSNHYTTSQPTHQDDIKCGNLKASDVPLDLSLTGRKRLRDGTTKIGCNHSEAKDKCAKDRKRVDEVSLASIKSNFPTLLNNSRAQSRDTQQAMLTAHIESGLSSHNVSDTHGPFTSLYQKHESGVPYCNTNSVELVQGDIQPLQIQQWLLAAVSAQKMQQMALSHISMLQQQAVNNIEPQRKHPDLVKTVAQPSVPLPQPNVSQQPIFSLPLNRRLRDDGPKNVLPNGRSIPSVASPNDSPELSQGQPGKRYRRYAKPPYSYVSLITLSILSSRDKKLRLSQILKRISEMFPFFNGSYQGWRDSVRHNLSQNECFVKVLKNPYRPTAKGNFWTVNLNSIPHELLLRQNTLVSRYAQDSGYRYRKDLSEVFDLRTGALKISVPRHLLRDADDPASSALSDDPAAVMEAILLEDTSDDDMSDFKDKISPEIRQFTLEDLFNQNEDGDDDSPLSARSKGRNNKTTFSLSQPPIRQTSNLALAVGSGRNRVVDMQNFGAMGLLPQVLLSQVSSHASQLPLSLSSTSVNPFAAAQTALLSKALAVTQLQGFDSLQKVLDTKQNLRKSLASSLSVDSITSPMRPSASPSMSRIETSPLLRSDEVGMHDQSLISEVSFSKKNKRKGVHPVRHTGNLGSTFSPDGPRDHTASPMDSISAMNLKSARTLSGTDYSEGESNHFCAVASSSTKSHSGAASPRHGESSEFGESRVSSPSVYVGQNGSKMPIQTLGTPSLHVSKMA